MEDSPHRKMNSQHANRRMLEKRPEGANAIRVFHRKPRGTKSARYLLKCGCCEETVEIYYDDDELEINGVLGSVHDWSSILLPLLEKVKAAR